MPNVMAALPNIGGAVCSTTQGLADSHYFGVPQTPESISAASEPKFVILWENVEDILLFNFFFSDCR